MLISNPISWHNGKLQHTGTHRGIKALPRLNHYSTNDVACYWRSCRRATEPLHLVAHSQAFNRVPFKLRWALGGSQYSGTYFNSNKFSNKASAILGTKSYLVPNSSILEFPTCSTSFFPCIIHEQHFVPIFVFVPATPISSSPLRSPASRVHPDPSLPPLPVLSDNVCTHNSPNEVRGWQKH